MLFFSQKALIFILFLHENICYGYSLEAPYKVLLVITHNAGFHGEIKKKSYADTHYYLGLCKGKAFFYLPGLWKYHTQLVPFPLRTRNFSLFFMEQGPPSSS